MNQSTKIQLKSESVLLDKNEIARTADLLSDYIQYLNSVAESQKYEAPESSINLPTDNKMLEVIEQVLLKFKNAQLKYVVVVGIGGSNLGTMAVYDAVLKDQNQQTNPLPQILFADTVSAKSLQNLINILLTCSKANEFAINVISKSGGTTETIANFEIIYSALREKFIDIDRRIIVTTEIDSKLWLESTAKKWSTVSLPNIVGGRYSVFSTVGLIPLALAGLNIQELLGGALQMRNACLQSDNQFNPALLSAVVTFLHYKNGVKINNSFFFNPELESLGKWCRQLMGESLGKQFDSVGTEVRAGITPIVSIGSTDLHSMAQLYFGGPKDKLTTIIYHSETESKLTVPNERMLPSLIVGINGKSPAKLMDAIVGGVAEAYKMNGLPYVTLQLPTISAETLGELLQFKMLETMFLAHLMNLNAFDQPNVEDYKSGTKKLLEST